ncbi:hypothetical protein BSKO_10602 [Bryopsis sp. KO-2023]|nr:hypothetical protein BSKO_10602 [Bryopsis sp. KO-2023]
MGNAASSWYNKGQRGGVRETFSAGAACRRGRTRHKAGEGWGQWFRGRFPFLSGVFELFGIMKRDNVYNRPSGGFWGAGAPRGSDAASWRRTEPLESVRPRQQAQPQRQNFQERQRESTPPPPTKVEDDSRQKTRKINQCDSPATAERTMQPRCEEEGGLTDLEKTFLTVKVPPTDVDVPPRVEHIIAPKEGIASDVISESLDLPTWFIKELIRFGAVYACPVHPLPPESMSPTPEQLDRLKHIRRETMKTFGRHHNLQQPRRLTTDSTLTIYSYVRVHVHPKRFPAFYRYNWSERIVWEGSGCVVVNKPPGCQVCSRVDNSLESVCAWVTAELNLRDELMTTHRLDMGTEGVVVLAKTREFASYFNRTICKKDRVKKVYRALTEDPPELGRLIHYMMVGQRGPGEPAHTVICEGDEPASLYAELVVLRVNRVKLTGEAEEAWGSEAFETLIELKTGRTHQIRAQLAAVGCPLLGDNLYRAVVSNENTLMEGGGLEGGEPKLSYVAGQCDCIGLQAYRLEIHDSRAPDYFGRNAPRMFEAGVPWWRAAW